MDMGASLDIGNRGADRVAMFEDVRVISEGS